MSRKPILNDDKETLDFSYRNIIMFFLPLAGAIVSLAYAVIFEFYFNYHLASIIVLLFFSAYLCCLILFKLNLVVMGQHALTINFLIQISIHTYYLFPKSTFFHIYFLVGIPLIYMLFTRQQKINRLIYSAISIILLFAIELWGFNINPVNIELSTDMLHLIKNANIISSVAVLSVTIFLFTNMMEKAEEKALLNSIKDHLTQLYNRRYFFEAATKMITKSRINNEPLSVAFLDLDYFKTINDEYGHYIGDQVLIVVSDLLKDNIKSNDLVARIGGEEFAILFDNTSSTHAVAKAEFIRQAVLLAEIPSTSKTISVSIGISELEEDDESINQLLKRADNALYQAKENGRNRVETALTPEKPKNQVTYLKSL